MPRSTRGLINLQGGDSTVLVEFDLRALVSHHRVGAERPCAHAASAARDGNLAYLLGLQIQRPTRTEGAVLFVTLDQNPHAGHDSGPVHLLLHVFAHGLELWRVHRLCERGHAGKLQFLEEELAGVRVVPIESGLDLCRGYCIDGQVKVELRLLAGLDRCRGTELSVVVQPSILRPLREAEPGRDESRTCELGAKASEEG
mmetsp:Transcript_56229/g.142284  ORF Transcript_56229/g.142284 Transcript_56229/m.142284 type:complete len:200 (-) Transcript_56229:365-964(-)